MYGTILENQIKISLAMYSNNLNAASSGIDTIYSSKKNQINEYFAKFSNVPQNCIDSITSTYNPDVYYENYVKCADNIRAASSMRSNQLVLVLSNFTTNCQMSDVSWKFY